jgi:hypothetical protein
VIVRDFAFHGNSAANRLRNYHDHGQIMVLAAVPPGQPGRNGRASRPPHLVAARLRPAGATRRPLLLVEEDALHVGGVAVLGDGVDEAAADVEDDGVVVVVGRSVPATGTSPRIVHVAFGVKLARSTSMSPRCRASA